MLAKKISTKSIRITCAASIAAAVIIIAVDCFAIIPNPALAKFSDDFVLFAVMAAIFPPALLHYMDIRWKRAFDAAIPDMLRDVADAQITGLSLIRAIEEIAKREYGPLSRELRKAVARMKWGASFDEAMEMFARGGGTPLAKRAIHLIVEASRQGGEVGRIMELTSSYARDTHALQRERETLIRPYLVVAYIAFFIFLFVAIMLQLSFFVPLEETLGKMARGPAVALTAKESGQYFFHMALIQGFFSGLVAGKMGEGSAVAGLKHSLIMLAVAYAALLATIGT